MKIVPVLVSDMLSCVRCDYNKNKFASNFRDKFFLMLSCVHCNYNKNKFASNFRDKFFLTLFEKWAPMAYFWCPSIREFYLDLVCANRICVLL